MTKAIPYLFALLFTVLICSCGIVAIGYSPNVHSLSIAAVLFLPIALPIVFLLLLFARKEVQLLPENSVRASAFRLIFYLYSWGTFIWLLFGTVAFEMGFYHCEAGFHFMDNTPEICVDRQVGVLLSLLFFMAWIVLSQKRADHSHKLHSFFFLTLGIAAALLTTFLLAKPGFECYVWGG